MSNNIDSIVREVTFNAPIEQVWKAITCPEEMQLWFGSAASFELQQGEQGYFEWEEECEGRFATSTLVEWALTSTDSGGTQLTLTESGFLQVSHKQANVKGWTQELADLQSYLHS